uniref:BPTI/Kunitz inhibitor domain-containing protein n=1 Tax=Tetraodon nigroviridis TaxID=99883 RepID=H3C3T1_TETNG
MNYLLVLGTLVAFCESQSIPEFCLLPKNEGKGSTFNFALYYDAAQDLCSPFIYKGEGGNGNRFANERDCMRNCSSNAEKFYPMDASLACHFKKESGKCGGQLLRFYYDPFNAKCKKFQWTGCVGNGNRFLTPEICNTTCAGIHGEHKVTHVQFTFSMVVTKLLCFLEHGEQEEEDEPDTPVGQ